MIRTEDGKLITGPNVWRPGRRLSNDTSINNTALLTTSFSYFWNHFFWRSVHINRSSRIHIPKHTIFKLVVGGKFNTSINRISCAGQIAKRILRSNKSRLNIIVLRF